MNKQEKAHDTRVFKFARTMAAAIAALPSDAAGPAAVLQLWIDAAGSAAVKCDAFWVMDNEPGRFADYTRWHPRLRSLRNTPIHGRQLFALFN